MTDTMSNIAKIMAQDFVSAVEQSEAAQAAAAELVMQSMKRARAEYQKSLDAVEELERKAAELVQQARAEKWRGQQVYDSALDECDNQLAGIRGNKIADRRKLKSLPGGKISAGGV